MSKKDKKNKEFTSSSGYSKLDHADRNDYSLHHAFEVLTRKEDELKDSGLGEIIFRYTDNTHLDVDDEFDIYLKQSIDFLRATLERFQDVIEEENLKVAEAEGFLDPISPDDIPSSIKQHFDFLDESEKYQKLFCDLIDGFWAIKIEDYTELQRQSMVLLLFYNKALNARSIPLSDLLPIIFKAEFRNREICTAMSLWIGDGGYRMKKDVAKNKKGTSYKKTKHQKNWSDMISIIEDLAKNKSFSDCTSFGNVVNTIRDEMVIRKKDKKNLHVYANKTISSCLEEVFDYTKKTFDSDKSKGLENCTQLLKLSIERQS